MEKTIDIVKNALEYYDNNQEKYENLFNNVYYVNFMNANVHDMGEPVITMYDSKKNKLFQSRYEIIGVLDNKTRVWIWGWSIPGIKKNLVQTVRKVLIYGLDLEPTDLYLRTELITSRFKIDSNAQLESHIAVVSYLSKKNIIFQYNESESNFSLENNDSNKFNLTNSVMNEILQDKIYIKEKKSKVIITYYLFLLDVQ